MKKDHYILDKESLLYLNGYIDIDNVKGFGIKPRNSIKYDGIEVGHLTIASPELIKKVLLRKTKRKINIYLNYLLSTTEEDDDSGESELIIDDVARFKAIIINKYSKFLDKRYIASLLKKIRFVEKQLISKINENSFNVEKQTHRRR